MSDLANSPVYPNPEFTRNIEGREYLVSGESGITLREHYAGLVMQGLQSNPDTQTDSRCAKWAVEAADELIAELSK